jgi:cation diffusion facilitator CzcD-associated flavoprotein CzcO
VAAATSPESTNLVDDEWSRLPTYYALTGSPRTVLPQDAPAFVGELYARDIPYAEKVRARVSQLVKDPKTAEELKHWYPSWCKRPTFHDEYLQAFNNPNVTLVHTDGKSVSSITPNGVVFEDKEYPVDVLIFATGYESPFKYNDPSSRSAITIIGRYGRNLSQKLSQDFGNTLHGVATHDFPNFFWNGTMQAGISANVVFTLDALARHIAYIITSASKGKSGKIIIEPTVEAENQWGLQIASTATAGAAMIGCTPSYLNAEGMVDKMRASIPPEMQLKAASRGIWFKGVSDYVKVIEAWRENGKLEGFEVNTA